MPRGGDLFQALRAAHPECCGIAVEPIAGEGWSGRVMKLPSPNPALDGALEIEDVAGEITIALGVPHAHIAADADPRRGLWFDPLALVGAILRDEVVASSGWIAGRLRVGALHERGQRPDLLVPGLERVSVRSWRGTADRDISIG